MHTQIVFGISEQVDSQQQNAVWFCVYCVLRVAKGSCYWGIGREKLMLELGENF